MIDPQDAYTTVIASLRPILETAGFRETASRYDEAAFGGRHTTFDRGDQEIRLAWDGKESWFVLDARPESHRRFPHGWVDLTRQRFDRVKADTQWVSEIVEDLTDALHAYLESPLT